MFKLEGKVQHYAWGGTMFIPELLGVSNTENKPFAEYWMGVHPSAPSMVSKKGVQQNLAELIHADSEKYLGDRVLKKFSDLPFLLKILDVREMLSIQVHPSKGEAEKGFELENKNGIPLNAPNRNYKDANHKPEMMIALSDFWLLHGFKPEEKLKATLSAIPEFDDLLNLFNTKGYSVLYRHVMELEQKAVDALLAPLSTRIIPSYDKHELSKSSPDFWAARAMKTYPNRFDRGIFSIYFFNLVNLKKGEAIFQGAGLPHAYLEGQNIELMSNSDNVLRGGLTPKYVDVPELMKHTLFEPITPQQMVPTISGPELHYKCPVPDFGLNVISLQTQQEYGFKTNSPELIFIFEGSGIIEGQPANKGDAFFVEPGESLNAQGTLAFVRAFVP